MLLSALSRYIETQRDLAQGKQARTKELTLYLASLESFVAGSIGVASGSCKSGKDRKGTLLMYMDAMLADFAKHQEFQSFDALSHDDAIPQQIKQIFLSNHHQQVASVGSGPGADGIKNLSHVFPQRVTKRFTGNELKTSNIIGSLNKPNALTTSHTQARVKQAMKDARKELTSKNKAQRNLDKKSPTPKPETKQVDQPSHSQTTPRTKGSSSRPYHQASSSNKKKSVKLPILLGIILLPTVLLSAICFTYAYMVTKEEKKAQAKHKLRP